MISIELFSRQDCSLCEEAREVLLSVREQLPFELTETYLEPGSETEERYHAEIPVVHVNGLFFARHSVSEEALLAYLRTITSSDETTV